MSAWKARPWPPPASIISTVRFASATSRSTTITRVPARASRSAAARPLPMPSPAAPPPVTIATLSFSPQLSGMSKLCVGHVVPDSCASLGPELAR